MSILERCNTQIKNYEEERDKIIKLIVKTKYILKAKKYLSEVSSSSSSAQQDETLGNVLEELNKNKSEIDNLLAETLAAKKLLRTNYRKLKGFVGKEMPHVSETMNNIDINTEQLRRIKNLAKNQKLATAYFATFKQSREDLEELLSKKYHITPPQLDYELKDVKRIINEKINAEKEEIKSLVLSKGVEYSLDFFFVKENDIFVLFQMSALKELLKNLKTDEYWRTFNDNKDRLYQLPGSARIQWAKAVKSIACEDLSKIHHGVPLVQWAIILTVLGGAVATVAAVGVLLPGTFSFLSVIGIFAGIMLAGALITTAIVGAIIGVYGYNALEMFGSNRLTNAIDRRPSNKYECEKLLNDIEISHAANGSLDDEVYFSPIQKAKKQELSVFPTYFHQCIYSSDSQRSLNKARTMINEHSEKMNELVSYLDETQKNWEKASVCDVLTSG